MISCELYVLEKSIKKINGVETGVAIERTLSEIEKIINYVTVAKICIRQKLKVWNYNFIFIYTFIYLYILN